MCLACVLLVDKQCDFLVHCMSLLIWIFVTMNDDLKCCGRVCADNILQSPVFVSFHNNSGFMTRSSQ